MKKVLFDDAPLVVDTILATKIGLNEAIIIQQIHYWLVINEKKQLNYYDGLYWTYNSMKEWNKSFPFFSEATLRRIFTNLEKLKILKSGNYNKLRMDRTKWYTIDYEQLDKYISNFDELSSSLQEENEKNETCEDENIDSQNEQIHLLKQANAFSQNEQMEESKMSECIQSKCVNAFSQNEQTNTRDYSKTSSETYSETSSSSLSDVVDFFQNNFYLLKAFEAELLSDWVKRYPPDLVLEAMKVARKNNARNLNYIERVLINWEQEGITNATTLESYLRNREESKNGQNIRNSKGTNDEDQYSGLGLKMSDLR